MKMLLSCCVGCAMMLACIAYASIPDYVDFYAIQLEPFNEGVQPAWDIPRNKFNNDDPVWKFGGDELRIDDNSTGLQVKRLWLEIEFVSPEVAEPWVSGTNNAVAYGIDPESDEYLITLESLTIEVRDERFVTWEWVFILDPGSEIIYFISSPNFLDVGTFDYITEVGTPVVLEINQLVVASHGSIIPAPASLLLCVIGIGCTLVTRRFRR